MRIFCSAISKMTQFLGNSHLYTAFKSALGVNPPAIIPKILANKPASWGGITASGANISQLIQIVSPNTIANKPPKELAFDQYTPKASGTKAATSVIL